MKKDWTYKKFEDCIENVKYTTKIQSKDYMASGEYPIISQEEELVSGYWNKNEDVFSAPRPLVVFGDHTRVLKYIDFDFVLGADGVKILLPIEDLEAKFLFYFLKWYNVPNLGYSRHYKLLKEISIPIPPLSIQHSIVAELDLLHSVISKKKEQLRELDNLAQSLFYQMFGDPITNPMGWEIKKLGEVAENCDYMRKPITASDRIPGNIPYYGASGIVDYVRDYIFDGDYLLVSEDGANLLARSTPIAFSISGKNWVNNHAHVLKFRESYTQLYVQTLINLIDISDIVTGAVQPKLNQAQLNKFPLPLPPLSLQQSFAAKVSAIEAQKQAITQSIQHTEALLAQRMDNYFS